MEYCFYVTDYKPDDNANLWDYIRQILDEKENKNYSQN
jgi:hypothetical protein